MRVLRGLVLVLGLGLGGCGSIVVDTGAARGRYTEHTAIMLFWGFFGDEVTTAGPGLACVEVGSTVGGDIINLITLGIVRPVHVEAWEVAGGGE